MLTLLTNINTNNIKLWWFIIIWHLKKNIKLLILDIKLLNGITKLEVCNATGALLKVDKCILF